MSVSAALAATACGPVPRLTTLPDKLRAGAPFLGMPADCRMVLDGEDDRVIGEMAAQALRREMAAAQRSGQALGPADFLAISGGGEDGAFGAGLLTAWSTLGTRPVFKAVTGVSTGALAAPFAFLGPAYDKELAQVYTEVTQADIMRSRGLLTALFADSLFDSAPLLEMIRRFVTPAFLAEIATEYVDKGRLLSVATTNLDIPVGVMWNMGSIAASGHPQAAELFSRILLASASVPGVFPPVMIDVEVGDDRYQEMHVDGGTVAQVVLYPPSLGSSDVLDHFGAADKALIETMKKRKRRLYVIRNSRLSGDRQTVSRSILKIAGRAISTLISTQGIGDLYQLYLLCSRDGVDYNVSFIPESFRERSKEPFDQSYMRKLYALGRELMLNGQPWHKLPPGYDPHPFSAYHPSEVG